MARVLPFVGTRYNPKALENLTSVMAPPYDVISPDQQEDLYKSSPFNIVRLILGKEQADDDEYNNKYQRAASYLKEWKGNGTLIDDPCKNYYIYQQEFRTPDKKKHVRTGFFAAILLEDPEKGMIHAHEHTFEGPKADRLKLLRSTHCNLSPIFCFYSDATQEVDQLLAGVYRNEPPRVEVVTPDKVIHRMWLLSNSSKVKRLSELMQSKDFFIADGHHRYETAVRYCQEMSRVVGRKKGEHPPFTYTLAFLTNCEAEGIVILPTHRVLSAELGEGVDRAEVVEDLKEFFTLKSVSVDLKKPAAEGSRLCAEIAELGQKGLTFAMVFPEGKAYVATLKRDAKIVEEMRADIHPAIAKLDVSILHEYVIPKIWVGNPEIELDDQDIFYVKDAGEAIKMLASRRLASVAFLLNAPKIEQVIEIASQNVRMPHKTTYFYPKLLSGLVLRDHSAPW